ncbi:unnamed protein product [Rhodiola kirilowii]
MSLYGKGVLAYTMEDNVGEIYNNMSILDLPNLVLECILEKQLPDDLCRMSSVCTELRDVCLSDHLWERHLRKKWGRVLGRESQWHFAMKNYSVINGNEKRTGLLGLLLHLSPFSWICSKHECSNERIRSTRTSSLVSLYSLLETGKLWFPAQVYNRENGHTGFMLSCYDAELNYDHRTDTFKARYPPHGTRALVVENDVNWERIRAPPVDTSPHDLHISDCLNDLHPGDHVEIQWRRKKEFPYGWWYGVVGHLESCDGNDSFCRCHRSDVVVLNFNQYAPASRWRHTFINRKDHREEGNEAFGFYGGIRKITSKDELLTWKQLWPTEPLE